MKYMQNKILIFVAIILVACFSLAFTSCSNNKQNALEPGANLQEPQDSAPYDNSNKKVVLTNKTATAEATALYDYILSTYKTKIISGQQESTWISTDYEFDYIFEATGKYPAIRGFDFIDDDFDGVVTRATDWAERGGIVTICWHCSSKLDKGYNACKNSKLTAEDWEAILTEGTQEHTEFIANMDKAGAALARLQTAGIPVIWRPYHESNGNWFWWGRYGGDYFKRLWMMTYDYFTNDLHLDNLIWMLGFSYLGISMDDYFPGTQYFDIIGADSYNVATFGAEKRLYDGVYELVGDSKPIAFHETGLIPTVEQFKNVPWAYFMTWHTTYLTEENSEEALYAIYNDPYVITLDDLPDFYSMT